MCSGPTLTLTGSALPPSAFQGKSNQIDNEGLWLYNTLWWSQYHQCVHVQEYIWFYQQQCLVITTKWIVCAATLTPSKSTIASSIVFLHIFYRKKHHITKTNSKPTSIPQPSLSSSLCLSWLQEPFLAGSITHTRTLRPWYLQQPHHIDKISS